MFCLYKAYTRKLGAWILRGGDGRVRSNKRGTRLYLTAWVGSTDWERNIFSVELCWDTRELSAPYLIITLLIWLRTKHLTRTADRITTPCNICCYVHYIRRYLICVFLNIFVIFSKITSLYLYLTLELKILNFALLLNNFS